MKKLTNDLVVEKLKEHYGNTLDYSLVNYVNSRTPIKLICYKHGVFDLYANNALQGKGGCPLCKRSIPDKESFIKLSREVHGNKYSYDKVNFINGSEKVIITCPIHGDFEQVARHHAIDKNGCPKCGTLSRAEKNTHSLQTFIEKARTIHGDKYDYSKVVYTKSSEKVCIICPEHGEFWLTPSHHLRSLGCPKCGIIKAANSNRMSIKEFIEKANKIHNNKYDYSNIRYRNTDKKVEIICPIHGNFWQTPHAHLRGCGCPECSQSIINSKNSFTKKEWIEKANKIHNNFYDYSKVDYNGAHQKVVIICPIHGEFQQEANDHLKGCGCPKCSFSKGEQYISNYLDSINVKYIYLKYIYTDFIIKNSNYFIVDFYIELNNNKYIIEYNGKLHYEYIPYFYRGNKLEFEKQLNRDSKLREYCKSNNILLLELKYDIPFNQIDNLIKNFLYG